MTFHGCAIQIPGARNSDGKLQVDRIFLDTMIANDSSQDTFMAIAVFEGLMNYVHTEFPDYSSVILQSDNGSAFGSVSLVYWIAWRNKQWREQNVATVKKYVYTEAQRGKTGLDAHFAFVSYKINQYVNLGGNVRTPADVFQALTTAGGISRTSSQLLDVHRNSKLFERFQDAHKKHKVNIFPLPLSTFSSILTPSFFDHTQIPGSSGYHAVEFCEDHLFLYQQLGIFPRVKLPMSQFTCTEDDALFSVLDISVTARRDNIQSLGEARYRRVIGDSDPDTNEIEKPALLTGDRALLLAKNALLGCIEEMKATPTVLIEESGDEQWPTIGRLIEKVNLQGWAVKSRVKLESVPLTEQLKRFLEDLFLEGNRRARAKVTPELAMTKLREKFPENLGYISLLKTTQIQSYFSKLTKDLRAGNPIEGMPVVPLEEQGNEPPIEDFVLGDMDDVEPNFTLDMEVEEGTAQVAETLAEEKVEDECDDYFGGDPLYEGESEDENEVMDQQTAVGMYAGHDDLYII